MRKRKRQRERESTKRKRQENKITGKKQDSESRMNEESRNHVENDKAYEKASNFGNILGKKPEGLRKYQGAILDGKQKE